MNHLTNEFPPSPCEVCGNLTNECPPSPFLPHSFWRCTSCQQARRIPYCELISAYSRREMYNELGNDYYDKYIEPTLSFYKKSILEFHEDGNTSNELKGDDWVNFIKSLKFKNQMPN